MRSGRAVVRRLDDGDLVVGGQSGVVAGGVCTPGRRVRGGPRCGDVDPSAYSAMGQLIVLGGAVYYFQYLRVDPARFDQIPTQVRVAVGLYAGAKAAAEQVAAEQAALDPE